VGIRIPYHSPNPAHLVISCDEEGVVITKVSKIKPLWYRLVRSLCRFVIVALGVPESTLSTIRARALCCAWDSSATVHLPLSDPQFLLLMEPIPLPSHIHYELLLQLLERQTLFALKSKSAQYEQVQALIIILRKALAQQKQLEESCERAHLPIDYRWSLNGDAQATKPPSGVSE
jgi:hypothetical protein